jgi:hypothetical protein
MEVGLGLWAAYLLNLVSIVLIYHGLFSLCKILYMKNVVLLVAFLVFVSPFAYVLAQVRSFAELMWVLSLTPFFGVVVLTVMYTSWMIRFYSVAFSVLAMVHFVFLRKSVNGTFLRDQARLEFVRGQGVKVRVMAIAMDLAHGKRGRVSVAKALRKYLDLVAVVFLCLALVSTLWVSGKVGLRDPTYQEALQFVASDSTEQLPYSGTSACVAFAGAFKENAIKAGLNCGYVVVFFPDGNSHALNAFNTTDDGLVFVEPQLDDVVLLTVGQPYWDRAKYQAPGYDDTVVGYTVDWQLPEA